MIDTDKDQQHLETMTAAINATFCNAVLENTGGGCMVIEVTNPIATDNRCIGVSLSENGAGWDVYYYPDYEDNCTCDALGLGVGEEDALFLVVSNTLPR